MRNVISSMFWSLIVFTACFEWEAITFLVKFQSNCPLDQMAILKSYYNTKEETKIVIWHIGINILNFVYHILSIVYIKVNQDQDGRRDKFTVVSLISWSALIFIYLTFTLCRLFYFIKSKFYDAYMQYRATFLFRAAAIYGSIILTITVQILNANTNNCGLFGQCNGNNRYRNQAIKITSLLILPIIFLVFNYSTDLIQCFNRY